MSLILLFGRASTSTWTVTGSGGATAGGAATLARTWCVVGSGGGASAGEAAVQVTRVYVGIGGATAGGAAAVAGTKVWDGSGGGLAAGGGRYHFTAFYTFQGSGWERDRFGIEGSPPTYTEVAYNIREISRIFGSGPTHQNAFAECLQVPQDFTGWTIQTTTTLYLVGSVWGRLQRNRSICGYFQNPVTAAADGSCTAVATPFRLEARADGVCTCTVEAGGPGTIAFARADGTCTAVADPRIHFAQSDGTFTGLVRPGSATRPANLEAWADGVFTGVVLLRSGVEEGCISGSGNITGAGSGIMNYAL